MTGKLTRAKRLLLFAGGAALVAATAAGVAIGHGGDTSKIHACVNGSGDLRIVAPDGTCKKNETPLDWDKSAGATPTRTKVFATRVFTSAENGTSVHLSVPCPAGSEVVGGGGGARDSVAVAFGYPAELQASYPTYATNPYDPGSPEGWAIDWAGFVSNDPVTLYVFAICETS